MCARTGGRGVVDMHVLRAQVCSVHGRHTTGVLGHSVSSTQSSKRTQYEGVDKVSGLL